MNTRELAGLIWLAVLFAVALAKGENRPIFGHVVRGFVDRRILLVTGGYAVYLSWIVLLAQFIGIWDTFLLSETIIWFFVSGFPLLLTVAEPAKDRSYFRTTIRSEFGIGLVFVFFVNLETFSLIWELLLQLVLITLVGMSILAYREHKYANIRLIVSAMLAGVIIAMAMYTAIELFQNREDIDSAEIVLSFLLAIWLLMATILFLIPLAYIVEYESAFAWMKAGSNRQPPSLRDKVALLIGVNVHLYDLNKFRTYWGTRIKNPPSFRPKVREARRFREYLRGLSDEREREEYRLLAYTRTRGADHQGRRRDRREFKETQDALRWVAICQMGHFRRRNGSYHPDIMSLLSDLTRHGLPQDHGITVKVSDDGNAWYGWRRTVSGWVFAIGATSAPPDERLYDGPEPPSEFRAKRPDGITFCQAGSHATGDGGFCIPLLKVLGCPWASRRSVIG